MAESDKRLMAVRGTIGTLAGSKEYHGVLYRDHNTAIGLLFGPEGTVCTVEAIFIPLTGPGYRMSFRVATVERSACDIEEVFVLASETPLEGGVGHYRGRSFQKAPVRGSGDVLRDAQGAARAFFDAPVEPATTELDFEEQPWLQVYRSLSPRERYIVDVLIMVAFFRDVLGPDCPSREEVRFHAMVTWRMISADQYQCEADLPPWHLSELAEVAAG